MWHVCRIILLSMYTILVGMLNAQEAEEQLVYVQALWRHGDRAPSGLPYPKDKHNETAWPRGWSQLTNLGMMQMYELGQFFQQRYASFITKFNPVDVNMVSSKSDRAIVSGQAMLRGFFPASGQEMWLSDEQWQPLPFSVASDNAELKPTSFDCPVYNRESEQENQLLFQNISQKYAGFFDFLANVTGYKEMDFKEAASLYNIQREIDHNMTQPAWVNQTWPQYGGQTTIEIIRDLKRIRRISEFNSPTKARLRGGLLMENWIARARKISLGMPVKPRKMKLYSAHDGTVLALMYALGIGNDLLVPYAACLIMEIYKKDDNDTTIKIFYKNGTTLYQLPVPGCYTDNNCTAAQLENATEKRFVLNLKHLDAVCGLNTTGNGVAGLFTSGYFAVSSIVLLLYGFLVLMFKL